MKNGNDEKDGETIEGDLNVPKMSQGDMMELIPYAMLIRSYFDQIMKLLNYDLADIPDIPAALFYAVITLSEQGHVPPLPVQGLRKYTAQYLHMHGGITEQEVIDLFGVVRLPRCFVDHIPNVQLYGDEDSFFGRLERTTEESLGCDFGEFLLEIFEAELDRLDCLLTDDKKGNCAANSDDERGADYADEVMPENFDDIEAEQLDATTSVPPVSPAPRQPKRSAKRRAKKTAERPKQPRRKNANP